MAQSFAELPQAETPRLLVRQISLADRDAVFDYTRNQDVTRYLSFIHTSPEDVEAYLEKKIQGSRDGTSMSWAFVEKTSGICLGNGGFSRWDAQNSVLELGYALSHKYWGQGYATEAVLALVDLGFGHYGANRIEARCFFPNLASARVLEKAGFAFEGILRQQVFIKGQFQDIRMYSILKSDSHGLGGQTAAAVPDHLQGSTE